MEPGTTAERDERHAERRRSRLETGAHNFRHRPFPHYSQPREVGCMSRDAESRWHNDSDQELRYYREPRPGCDLSVGFESFVKKDEEKEKEEHIIPILSWLAHRRAQHSTPPDSPDHEVINRPHFVAWRGMFARLLCTPYNRSESWRFVACRHKGTIYIAEKPTEADLARRRNQTQREELMCYWGYKFEDYATRSRQAKAESSEEPVSNIPCYCTVVRARLGSHLILMSGETDCCIEDDSVRSTDRYVELKTSKMITTERDRTSFERYKLIKFWSQSYLAGIPRVVVGFRDDEGIVRTIQHFKTLDMPRFVQGKRGLWDPAICMNFCEEFLSWLSSLFADDASEHGDAQRIWVLDFASPFTHVEATPSDDGSFAFLPAWFTSPDAPQHNSTDIPPSASDASRPEETHPSESERITRKRPEAEESSREPQSPSSSQEHTSQDAPSSGPRKRARQDE